MYNEDNIKEQFGEREEEEYKELIWQDIKEINKDLPTYKHIKEIIITNKPLEKNNNTKSKKICRTKEPVLGTDFKTGCTRI